MALKYLPKDAQSPSNSIPPTAPAAAVPIVHAAREADDGAHAGRHRRASCGADLRRRDPCRSSAGDSPGN